MLYKDASAKNILEMLGKVEQWPRWDRTLSTVEVLDRIDDKNDILHIGLKKFFPAFSSLTETLTLSKSIGTSWCVRACVRRGREGEQKAERTIRLRHSCSVQLKQNETW